MFWYILSLTGKFDNIDDLRWMDDRETALMFRKILGVSIRVMAK